MSEDTYQAAIDALRDRGMQSDENDERKVCYEAVALLESMRVESVMDGEIRYGLPFLNSTTKEAYEAGVASERARAERYRRRAFAMRRALGAMRKYLASFW